jgi:transcriptional regulator with XRE-family HTH domain
MGELARRTNYSKGYLSKIENDLKRPNATMARLCDAALSTDGALSALVPPSDVSTIDNEVNDNEVWVMSLDQNGDLRFHQIDRRQVLAGAGAMLGFAITKGSRPATDERAIAGLRASFDQIRQLGMLTSPVAVLGPVIAQVHTLRTLALDNPEPVRSELLLLASRVAEYAGWMSQEAGDDRAALWWTRRAVEFAESGRDRHLASYALVREAEIALYQQDAIGTIDLARLAQAHSNAGPRIRGLAARCEAQGHALAGDVAAYEGALDRATELLAAADADCTTRPVLGSSSVTDQVSLARGWALHDLGRPAEAAAVLDVQVAGIPATARRARARFGARRALAHANNGEIDHACVVMGEVLDDAAHVDSATVRVDLRSLARTLARWRNHATVRELFPELSRALNAPQRTR